MIKYSAFNRKVSTLPQMQKSLDKEISDIESVNNNFWKRIFNLPFSTTRDTNIQSFLFRIIHKIIPCNKLLHTIKIKKNALCNFCDDDDDMLHFFINCKKVKEFWIFWINCWENISRMPIKHSNVLNECILLGLPNNKAEIQVFNYCLLHT